MRKTEAERNDSNLDGETGGEAGRGIRQKGRWPGKETNNDCTVRVADVHGDRREV